MSRSTRCALLVTAVTFSAFVPVGRVKAALAYLSVPGIAGEESTPGYPGVMAAKSVTVVTDGFSVVKNVDVASPDIFGAVVAGTPLGTGSLLFYNGSPAGPPDAKLLFPNLLASSYQPLGGGGTPTEEDAFSSTTPGAIYLGLPGIAGESSTPGHPGVIQIQSFSLSGNEFSVLKPVDAASPSIFSAVASGKHFSTASLLFYGSLPPTGEPSATLVFHAVLASSYQPSGSGSMLQERDAFNFVSFSQPTPEPAGAVMMIIGSVPFVQAGRRANANFPRGAAALESSESCGE